jgi:hypothetical protein
MGLGRWRVEGLDPLTNYLHGCLAPESQRLQYEIIDVE